MCVCVRACVRACACACACACAYAYACTRVRVCIFNIHGVRRKAYNPVDNVPLGETFRFV